MTDRTAKVENGLWCEIGVGVAQPEGARFADIIEILAHQAEGKHRQAVLVGGAGGHIVGAALRTVAAGHVVDIDRRDAARHFKGRVKGQGTGAAGRQRLRGLRQPRGIAVDGIIDAGPDHLLRTDAQGRIKAEIGIGPDGGMDGAAIAGWLGQARYDGVFVAGLEGRGHVIEDMTAQAGGEILRRLFIAGRPYREIMGDKTSHGRCFQGDACRSICKD